METTKADYQEMVRHPGKFEGEPAYVPYFWDEVMNGDGDYEYPDCDCGDCCECPYEYISVSITDDDRQIWPELGTAKEIRLWESDSGFVYHNLA